MGSSSYSAKQRKIYSNVASRGYADGFTNEAFLCRQAVKLLEESCELFLAIPWRDKPEFTRLRELVLNLQRKAKLIFDDKEAWEPLPVDPTTFDEAIGEGVDVQVVLSCLATAWEMLNAPLTANLMVKAEQKSKGDIERGVR